MEACSDPIVQKDKKGNIRSVETQHKVVINNERYGLAQSITTVFKARFPGDQIDWKALEKSKFSKSLLMKMEIWSEEEQDPMIAIQETLGRFIECVDDPSIH